MKVRDGDPVVRQDGKPVTQRTFGIRAGQDRDCRRLAVELDLSEQDLRLFGRYVHHNGYRSIAAVRDWLRLARAKNV